jgi:hypothetical protein
MLADVAVVGLSTFGLAYILRYTDGPFNLFVKFRGALGLRRVSVYDENGDIVDYVEESDDRFFAKLIGCFWCLSTWISLVLSLLIMIPLLQLPLVWFGALGISGTLHKFVEG